MVTSPVLVLSFVMHLFLGIFCAFCASSQTLDWCWITCLTTTTDKSVLLPPLRSLIVKMMSSQALTSISSIQYPLENSGRQSRSVDESRRRQCEGSSYQEQFEGGRAWTTNPSVKKQKWKKQKVWSWTWNSLQCDPRQEGGLSKTLQEDQWNEIVHSQRFRTFTADGMRVMAVRPRVLYEYLFPCLLSAASASSCLAKLWLRAKQMMKPLPVIWSFPRPPWQVERGRERKKKTNGNIPASSCALLPSGNVGIMMTQKKSLGNALN